MPPSVIPPFLRPLIKKGPLFLFFLKGCDIIFFNLKRGKLWKIWEISCHFGV